MVPPTDRLRELRERHNASMQSLLEDKSTCDVQLRCGDVVVPVHSLILRVRSHKMRETLAKWNGTPKPLVINVPDLGGKMLPTAVHHIYLGDCPRLTREEAEPMLELSAFLGLDEMSQYCGLVCSSSVDDTTVVSYSALAKRLNAHPLLESCFSTLLLSKDETLAKKCAIETLSPPLSLSLSQRRDTKRFRAPIGSLSSLPSTTL